MLSYQCQRAIVKLPVQPEQPLPGLDWLPDVLQVQRELRVSRHVGLLRPRHGETGCINSRLVFKHLLLAAARCCCQAAVQYELARSQMSR